MMIKIAALQLESLSNARLDYYFKICKDRDVKIILLAEYVLNDFFKDLLYLPKNIIEQKNQKTQNEVLNLSLKYDLCTIAPTLHFEKDKIYKVMGKFDKNLEIFIQNFLITYQHWNEASFFNNDKDKELNFCFFKYENFNIGVMFGFEAHFDDAFKFMRKKNIDILLIPSACAFNSQQRWEELLKTRAFTNNIYIIKANRIGIYEKEDWKFYGQSMLINPNGEISQKLGDFEELLIAEISKKELEKARDFWAFNNLQKD